jgi:hypothetical protein
MVYVLLGISLFILLTIGLAALFLAGKDHASGSQEDLSKDED